MTGVLARVPGETKSASPSDVALVEMEEGGSSGEVQGRKVERIKTLGCKGYTCVVFFFLSLGGAACGTYQALTAENEEQKTRGWITAGAGGVGVMASLCAIASIRDASLRASYEDTIAQQTLNVDKLEGEGKEWDSRCKGLKKEADGLKKTVEDFKAATAVLKESYDTLDSSFQEMSSQLDNVTGELKTTRVAKEKALGDLCGLMKEQKAAASQLSGALESAKKLEIDKVAAESSLRQELEEMREANKELGILVKEKGEEAQRLQKELADTSAQLTEGFDDVEETGDRLAAFIRRSSATVRKAIDMTKIDEASVGIVCMAEKLARISAVLETLKVGASEENKIKLASIERASSSVEENIVRIKELLNDAILSLTMAPPSPKKS
jgi:predicted  nucleic acid-binding Zn-ribbon protein